MEKLTHWKKTCNTNYLGSWDLETSDGFGTLTLTIKNVCQEEILEPSTNKKSIETVINFVENYKPMILNSTNKKAIAKSTSSNFIEKWAGHKIKIGVKKVKAFGDVFDALRVSPIRIKPETAKCDICGKEMDKNLYDRFIKEYGKGFCCKECKDKYLKENKDE